MDKSLPFEKVKPQWQLSYLFFLWVHKFGQDCKQLKSALHLVQHMVTSQQIGCADNVLYMVTLATVWKHFILSSFRSFSILSVFRNDHISFETQLSKRLPRQLAVRDYHYLPWPIHFIKAANKHSLQKGTKRWATFSWVCICVELRNTKYLFPYILPWNFFSLIAKHFKIIAHNTIYFFSWTINKVVGMMRFC